MRVGLVGVGKMGTPIGLHILAAGYPLAVYDIRPGQMQAPMNAGATAAGSAREVAEQSDVVFTSLPGPGEILEVSRGEQGLLAGIPLAMGTGVGSELRRPLGITIIGGLLLSQLLTLFTTPVIYLAFDRLGGWLKRHRRRGPGEQLSLPLPFAE